MLTKKVAKDKMLLVKVKKDIPQSLFKNGHENVCRLTLKS